MIPLFKVHYPKGIGQRIEEVFASGTITEGDVSDQFEQMVAKLIGNPYTSLVNSCTSALTLAYRACGVGPGTEVISSPMTCMATNEPIDTMGADIVWADIDPRTGNISPESVERRITDRTRAIVAVHWAGQPFAIDEVRSVAAHRGIPVIEDAAHALGAKYKGKLIGSHSEFVCFSFQAIKHLTTGDGGAISCSSAEMDARIKKLKWFGLDRKYKGSKWKQDITESGYKFHMNNLTAMIGVEQMKYIEEIVAAHVSNGRFYDAELSNPKIEKLARPSGAESAHWIYTLLCDERDRLQEYLASRGIHSDVVHVRNDTYSVFRRFRRDDLPGTTSFCDRMLNIPVGWWLSAKDREYVVETVNQFR